MGVRLLNTFLQVRAQDVTKKLNLQELRNKRIVVDASIYMYRFRAANALIENMYMLCSLFRYYGIHTLFVFDGKGRREAKRETIQNRRKEKQRALDKYNEYERQLSHTNGAKKDKIINKMGELRRTFVRLSSDDMKNIKDLLDAYGIMYKVADGEADELCAALVLKGAAYACLSEDTDLFAYGCPRVLKYISLINHTTVMYDLSTILSRLDMSMESFRTMCLASGTDYIAKGERNIFQNYDLYKSYTDSGINLDFIHWLSDNKYLENDTYKKIMDEDVLCRDTIKNTLNKITYFFIRNRNVNHQKLKSVLKKDGFIFPQ